MKSKYFGLLSTFSRLSLAVVMAASVSTAGFFVPGNSVSAAAGLAKAKVSFTFDDGVQSSYTQAAPVLAKYGLKGTSFVATGCVGMTWVPNRCHAKTDTRYMTWKQVTALQNTYGWEIGSHTVSHPYLASFDASDGQPKPLTPAQVEYELSKSKSDLVAHGIAVKSFASPYGDYNMFTLKTVAKYYANHRGFAEQNNNVYPYNDMLLNNMQVQNPVSVATVKAKIDYAIANKTWLVLTFHDIFPNASTDPDQYQYSSANLAAIASYVKAKQEAGLIQNVNIAEGTVSDSVNLLPSATSGSQISGGWTTDNPQGFSGNGANNGSYPEPASSIAITGTISGAHLFSPKVTVDPATMYVLKNFLNVTAISRGEVGFYIDEYDQSGNWISGQYKGRENSVYVENMNFTYQPSSIRVRSASLQVYTTAGSNIRAFLDSSQWFTAATMPLNQSDLMTNGSFEAGMAPWTTDDSTTFQLDTNGNGAPANPRSSVAISKSSTQESHLFAPKVQVAATGSYYLQTYLNLLRAGGEVGFYIDEYDQGGNWISGQYKRAVSTPGTTETSFEYKPSSANVSSASLQIIASGADLSGYIDNVRFWKL